MKQVTLPDGNKRLNNSFGTALASAIALSVCGLVPAIAFAQGDGGDSEVMMLEEVTVTARKREESIQDVPISIDVLGGDALVEQGLLNLSELQFAVPGFYVQSFETRATITMRGVGAQIAGGTSSVATHLNGIYQASAAAQLNRLFDIQRVEVVKGPQGTLYGRNSTGGALNIITKKAGDALEADVSVGYGTFETVRINGGVSIPINEDWGVRLAGSYSEGDGQFRNLFNNQKVGNEDFTGGRVTLTGSAGGVSVEAFAQVTNDKSNRPLLLIPVDNATSLPLLDWDQTFLDNPTEPLLERDATMLGLTLSGDINDNYSWRSITGYLDYDEPSSIADVNPAPMAAAQQIIQFPQSAEQFSQEFQLLYTGDRLNWILGAYYLDDDQGSNRIVEILPFFPIPVFDNAARDRVEVFSVFFDINYSLTDKLTLNAGIRYNDEDVRNTFSGTGLFDGAPFDISGSQGDPTGRLGLDYMIRDDLMVYGSVSNGYQAGFFTTQFDPDSNENGPSEVEPEDIVAFEVGLKSALPDNRGFFNVALFSYDYSDMQVQVGGFPLDENGNPDPTQPPVFFTDNAGSATIRGIDIQLTDLRVNDHLKFDLSGSLLDATYDDFQTVENGMAVNYAGNSLPRAPDYTATVAATLDNLQLGSSAVGSVRLEYNLRDKTFFTPDNNPVASQDSFGLLNLYARIDIADTWAIGIAGRNLADEKFYDFRNQVNFANTGEFRTWQVTLEYTF